MESERLGQQRETEREDAYQVHSGCTFAAGEWQRQPLRVVKEMPLTVSLNKRELVTLLCTPDKLTELVLGFLHLEGLIKSADEVAYLRVCAEESAAEVRLIDPSVQAPTRRVVTTGCGGGVGLSVDTVGVSPLESNARLSPDQVLRLARLLREHARLYAITGGVHTSMLSDGEQALAIAEDVGRHNTIDKIDGECLLAGAPTAGRFLVTTGRISSEMLLKAARMGVPIVVSRTSPTHRAVVLAEQLGITLVGYARGATFSVYAHGERIVGCGWPEKPRPE